MNYLTKNLWKAFCVAAAVVLIAGCAKKEESPPGLLQYVPAEER